MSLIKNALKWYVNKAAETTAWTPTGMIIIKRK
jgi:hypothetical protein